MRCRARVATRGYARPQVTVNASYGEVTMYLRTCVYARNKQAGRFIYT